MRKNRFLIASIAIGIFIGQVTCASAMIFEMDFVAANFVLVAGPDTNSPVSSVSGTILFEADYEYAYVTAIDSINLTIDGHTYTKEEVDFTNATDRIDIGGYTWIDGYLEAKWVAIGTNDFAITMTPSTWELDAFLFASANYPSCAWSSSFESFSINPVPEPTAMLLLAVGLIGLAGYGRKKLI